MAKKPPKDSDPIAPDGDEIEVLTAVVRELVHIQMEFVIHKDHPSHTRLQQCIEALT